MYQINLGTQCTILLAPPRFDLKQMHTHTHVLKNVHWICCGAGRPHASSTCKLGSITGSEIHGFVCYRCTHTCSKTCIGFTVVQGGRTPAAPANSAASQAAESTVLFVTNAHTHVFKNVHWIYCGVGRPPLLQMHTHVFKNVHWICCAAGRPHASSACGPGSSMGRKDCILPAPKGSPRQPFEPHLRPCPLLLW